MQSSSSSFVVTALFIIFVINPFYLHKIAEFPTAITHAFKILFVLASKSQKNQVYIKALTN